MGELEEKNVPHRGILDAANATSRFDLRRYHPSPALAHLVEHYWIVRWDLHGAAPYTAEVLPHPSVNLAFTRERGWVTGVTTGKYTYDLTGDGLILGIMFRPGAFRPFLGRSVSTITDKTLPATEIFPDATDAFRETLLGDASNEPIVAGGESILLSRLPAPDPNIELVNRIIDAVRDDRDVSQVAGLAERFDLSERTLQHLFSTYVGVGLKWIIRRYRIMEAAERVEAGGDESWTTIAHDLGYSDHAHFTNDFTKLIGRPPTDHARLVARG